MIRRTFGFEGLPRAAYVLLAGNMLTHVGLGLFFPILPLYILHRGGSPLLVGTISAAALVANVLAQAPGGWLADRFDRRVLVIVTTCLYAAFFLVYLFPVPVVWLVAIRFGHALIGGFYTPPARALLSDLAPHERRGAAFGHWNASEMGGFLIGPVIGGIVGVIWLNGVFIGAFMAGVVAAILTFTLPVHVHAAEPPAHRETVGAPRSMWHLAMVLLPALLAGSAWQYLGGVYGAVWTLFVTSAGGSPFVAGVTVSVYSLPIVLFSGAAGRLTDRVGARPMVGITLLAGGFFAAVYAFTRSIPLIIILGLVEALCTLAGYPAVMAEVSRRVDSSMQGRAQGLLTGVTASAQALGALAGGFLFGIAVPLPFLSITAVCFVALLAVPFMTAPQRRVAA